MTGWRTVKRIYGFAGLSVFVRKRAVAGQRSDWLLSGTADNDSAERTVAMPAGKYGERLASEKQRVYNYRKSRMA